MLVLYSVVFVLYCFFSRYLFISTDNCCIVAFVLCCFCILCFFHYLLFLLSTAITVFRLLCKYVGAEDWFFLLFLFLVLLFSALLFLSFIPKKIGYQRTAFLLQDPFFYFGFGVQQVGGKQGISPFGIGGSVNDFLNLGPV